MRYSAVRYLFNNGIGPGVGLVLMVKRRVRGETSSIIIHAGRPGRLKKEE